MNDLVEVRHSKVHGRGVFAKVLIPKGTELFNEVILVASNVVNQHTYPWSTEHHSICVGFGSFFNHSKTPNMKISRISKSLLRKYFVSLCDIQVNEELFIKYSNNEVW
jgi:SET domain-containing protein